MANNVSKKSFRIKISKQICAHLEGSFKIGANSSGNIAFWFSIPCKKLAHIEEPT